MAKCAKEMAVEQRGIVSQECSFPVRVGAMGGQPHPHPPSHTKNSLEMSETHQQHLSCYKPSNSAGTRKHSQMYLGSVEHLQEIQMEHDRSGA